MPDMPKTTFKEVLEEWLKDKPDSIRQLAAEFPPGLVFCGPDPRLPQFHLVGYAEPDMLMVSVVDPGVHFELSMAAAKPVPAQFVRQGKVRH